MLIQENASEVANSLDKALSSGTNIQLVLNRVGPLLLQLVTSDKAIALSRAAAADVSETGLLGQSLAEMGRDTVGPLIKQIFDQAKANGTLTFQPSDNVTEVYLGLLIGDIQIRRATGSLSQPTKAAIRSRANRASTLFLQLYAA